MAVLVLLGAMPLVMAIAVVASGIYIRVGPPAQRRTAWLTFASLFLALVLSIAYWWVELNLSSLEALPVVSGWTLACIIPLLIMMGAVSIGFLVFALRLALADHTTSRDVPPQA
jgi:hypothetical protein